MKVLHEKVHIKASFWDSSVKLASYIFIRYIRYPIFYEIITTIPESECKDLDDWVLETNAELTIFREEKDNCDTNNTQHNQSTQFYLKNGDTFKCFFDFGANHMTEQFCTLCLRFYFWWLLACFTIGNSFFKVELNMTPTVRCWKKFNIM